MAVQYIVYCIYNGGKPLKQRELENTKDNVILFKNYI